MPNQITVRIPPSPTGHLHLGTARTALFNYLFAKKNNARIVFRWEDTDLERSKSEFETEILDGLRWLGMDFMKLSEKIYRQTESAPSQKKWIEKLWEEEKIFPCFTPAEDIESARTSAEKAHKNFVFWSPFRDLKKDDAQKKIDAKEPFVWRVKTPRREDIKFEDLIRKNISVNSETLGDFVVARADGSMLYLLANVIDDFEQGITHVLRGEDGISNTPKQILLWGAIGQPAPRYGHIPLVLDSQKRKLSKRNVEPGVCVLISDFQAAGFIPEGVVNGLAFLGWNPKSTEEIFSLEDLEKIFDLAKVNPGAAQYDFEKMKWFNAQWMRKISLELLQKYFHDFSGKTASLPALEVAREKARTLVELADELGYLTADPGFDEKLLANEKMKFDAATAREKLAVVEKMLTEIPEEKFNRDMIKEASIVAIEKLGCKNGEFLWPFRVALSNRAGSAGPFEISEVIGKKETMKRIQRALGK